MSTEPNLSLRRSKRTGIKVCLSALILGAAFVYGIAGESYWALAIPVALAVGGVLWLAFWIGWTINTIDTIPKEAEPYESRFARRAGLGLAIGSVAMGVIFMAGIWRQSYWAVALPMAVLVLGLLGMIFHIGWAIAVQRVSLPAEADAAELANGSGGGDQTGGDDPPPPPSS